METPYMVLAFPGTERIEDFRVGAYPHDLTVRPQTVNREWSPDYHRLISLFAEQKGQGCYLEHLAQPPRVPNG
jgi:predicted NodU family carbamoyl transferase